MFSKISEQLTKYRADAQPEYNPQLKPAKKKKSRFRRGDMVTGLIFSPGQNGGHLTTLRKEENILKNKNEDQSFLIVEPPALWVQHKEKIYYIYLCDAEKGVTVDVKFYKGDELAQLFCDPRMVNNVFDESFISRATNIKPDWKQLIGVGLFSGLFFFVFGLMF
ncbi:hypothetical protein ACSAZL_12455 [Methanosarcina sp. T3]|uniref:hypothetical protein n=1 Tax=Methanosarcina sp. T3 TaxID=3439062 RepID=UPI003F878AD3